MGSDLKNRNIHIEFYGLPGCGKSTLSEIIAQRYESEGHNVLRASAETGNDMNPVVRKLIKFIRASSFYIKHPKIYKNILGIVKNNEYTQFKEQMIQLINIAQKLYHYSKPQNGCVFIWDEGLTQAAISLAINGRCSGASNEDELLRQLKADNIQIHIYIKESIETVLNRMDNRATNNSRVEKLNSIDEKKELLVKYEKAAESIKKSIVVCGNGRSVNEIVEDIWSKLSKVA